jgi:hypothetical protein
MADHNAVTSFSRFITLLLFSLFVTTGLAAGASVSFNQSPISVIPGAVTTVNLTLDAAPAGLSGFAISIRMEDPTIGEISAVTLPEWADLSDIAGVPGPEVMIMAAAMQGPIENDAAGILLATLSVRGLSSGTTEILLEDPIFDDDDGNELAPALSGLSLTVATEGSTLPSTTTATTTTTTSSIPATTTTTAPATTGGSVLTGGSGGGGSGGGSSSYSSTIPATTPATGTAGSGTTVTTTAEEPGMQTPVMTVPATSPAALSTTLPETAPPAPGSQGIPFITVPGILVLIGAMVLLGHKKR